MRCEMRINDTDASVMMGCWYRCESDDGVLVQMRDEQNEAESVETG